MQGRNHWTGGGPGHLLAVMSSASGIPEPPIESLYDCRRILVKERRYGRGCRFARGAADFAGHELAEAGPRANEVGHPGTVYRAWRLPLPYEFVLRCCSPLYAFRFASLWPNLKRGQRLSVGDENRPLVIQVHVDAAGIMRK